MSFLKREKTLSEIEEEAEHEEAELKLDELKAKRRLIKERLGEGAINRFKSEGDTNESAIQKAWRWIKTH